MRAKLNKISKRINSTFKNNAFITLFATTLGVLLAFYLNGIAESSDRKNRELQGYSNIIAELEKNKAGVQNALRNDSVIIQLELVKKYDKHLSGQIIAQRRDMSSIMRELGVGVIVDSSDIGNGNVEYFVDYINLGFSISTLPKVAWIAAQMADITNEINYDCLSTIIDIYTLQDLYESEHYKLLDYFTQGRYYQFYRTMLITRSLRTQLLEQYDIAIDQIENCS